MGSGEALRDRRGRLLRAHRFAASIATYLADVAELASGLGWGDLAIELDRAATAIRRLA